MAGSIEIIKEGAIGTLVVAHEARHNALTSAMWRAIPPAARALSDDPEVRVVVLRGAGSAAFVAGADISEFEESRRPENREQYDRENALAYAAIAAIDKPVIAMIHGFCIGGGLAIALQADLRYVAEDAQLGIPAARLGLGYGYDGLRQLTALVGPSHAKEMLFTAKRFGALEAHAMGLVNGVFTRHELEPQVHEIAHTIARNAPLTIRSAKRSIDACLVPEGERDLGRIEAAIASCYASEDYREGVRAFLEKRAARFTGR